MPRTSDVAESVIQVKGAELLIGTKTIIMDYCVLGVKNPWHKDLFETKKQKIIRIGDRCIIFPWTMLYEGAVLENDVQVGERCTIGSRTQIGQGSRLVYGAQVHDKVIVGEKCIIGGFVADNCVIGNKCSIFGALVHRYKNSDTTSWDETDEIGPTLEDDVVIGWGAVVAGEVRIGKGTLIKPNTLVTEDLAAGVVYG